MGGRFPQPIHANLRSFDTRLGGFCPRTGSGPLILRRRFPIDLHGDVKRHQTLWQCSLLCSLGKSAFGGAAWKDASDGAFDPRAPQGMQRGLARCVHRRSAGGCLRGLRDTDLRSWLPELTCALSFILRCSSPWFAALTQPPELHTGATTVHAWALHRMPPT